MRTRTWPAARRGVETSSSFKTSGPPNSWTTMAFIIFSLPVYWITRSFAWFRGGELEDEDFCGEQLHLVAILIERDVADAHDGLIGLGARRNDFEDLAFHAQRIARTHRLGPNDFATEADDAGRQGQTAVNEETHGHGSHVPAAGGESAENAALGSGFVQMERLRIEFRGEGFDASFVHAVDRRGEALADGEVVQI